MADKRQKLALMGRLYHCELPELKHLIKEQELASEADTAKMDWSVAMALVSKDEEKRTTVALWLEDELPKFWIKKENASDPKTGDQVQKLHKITYRI